MYDIRLKALYNENIMHNVTITGSESSNGTTSHYYGENVSINVGKKDGYIPLITISPDDVKNTSSDINVVKFTMPDNNVSISVNFILDKYLPRLTLKADHKDLLGYTGEANEHVTIPSTLKVDDKIYRVAKMDSNAFKDCSNISSVTLEPGISYIAGFTNCSSLTSVTIPDSVAIIGTSTFKGCTSLKEINIPDSVTSIGFYSFNNCPASINIDKPSESISTLMWENGGTIKWLRTPFTVTSANINSFKSNKTVKIPYHFTGNDGIKYEVTKIEADAFVNSSDIQLVEIPYSIKSLPENIFSNCTKLTSIVVDGYPEVVTGAPWGAPSAKVTYNRSYMEISYDGEIYASDHVYRDNIEFTGIPEEVDGIKVTALADYAFDGIRDNFSVNFDHLIIPDGITRIGECALNLYSINSIYIPSSVTYIHTDAFIDTPGLNFICIDNSPDKFFSLVVPGARKVYVNDKYLSIDSSGNVSVSNVYKNLNPQPDNIYIGDTVNGIKVTGIAADGFTGLSNLKYIFMSDAVKTISNRAFKNCTSLSHIRIPDGITKINDETFRNCSEYYIGLWNITEIGSYAFEGCQWGLLNYLRNITKIGVGAFQNSRYRRTDATIEIDAAIQSIGANAFNGITGVKSIYIVKSVNSISGAPWGAPSNVTIRWKS